MADSAPASSLAVAAASPPWTPDLGDGRYKNPVVHADYADPDAIRVGDDFYLVASSMHAVPGLPVLHSRDLIHWRILGHVLPFLTPRDHFSRVRHDEGAWAPAIRHHAGLFWVFYGDPDFGLYFATAADPAGPWSEPRLFLAGRGFIDPCPFWDETGALWVAHAFARSRAGVNNRIALLRVDADRARVVEDAGVIIDADLIPGMTILEGPKLYRRGGYFYVFAPANGVHTGEQFVFRARSLRGPWEHRVTLAEGATPVNGPHQGAWVDTPGGEHWFLHFQSLGAHGRVLHLQPMRWREDGWPEMGVEIDERGVGRPALAHRKPALPAVAERWHPQTSDDFSGPALSPAWQWQANPEPFWATFTARPGWLRLAAVSAGRDDTLYHSPNLLLQKFPAPAFVAEVKIDGSGLLEGERAGLVVFGRSYVWVGLLREGGATRLVSRINRDAHLAGAKEREAWSGPAVPDGLSALRVEVAGDPPSCRFFAEVKAAGWMPAGEAFVAEPGRWVGARVGLFASGPACERNPGHADFAWFEYRPPDAAE